MFACLLTVMMGRPPSHPLSPPPQWAGIQFGCWERQNAWIVCRQRRRRLWEECAKWEAVNLICWGFIGFLGLVKWDYGRKPVINHVFIALKYLFFCRCRCSFWWSYWGWTKGLSSSGTQRNEFEFKADSGEIYSEIPNLRIFELSHRENEKAKRIQNGLFRRRRTLWW